MKTLRELLEKGKIVLREASVENGDWDAWLLLEHVCGVDRSYYFLHDDEMVSKEQEKNYEALIERRKEHVPLQHLTHEAWFYGRKYFVNEHVLIPRQDTEVLIEEVIKSAKDTFGSQEQKIEILDMCTGSGCILSTLLLEIPKSEGTGADLSEEALKTAKKNMELLNVNSKLVKSDLFSQIDGRYDIIVSNPPYIETREVDRLMEEVRDHEPRMALDGREDGLYFYREIVKASARYLRTGGWLCFEIGYNQGREVKEMMQAAGYEEVSVIQDLAGLNRVVKGRLIQEEPNVR